MRVVTSNAFDTFVRFQSVDKSGCIYTSKTITSPPLVNLYYFYFVHALTINMSPDPK